MKTLILNGSPRKNGDTAALLSALRNSLGGEFVEVRAYSCNIAPCVDCRYCVTHPSCAIHDDMDAVFAEMNAADNIVIASPVYFSQPTGALLNILSRLQFLYTSKFLRGMPVLTGKKKNGIILLTGGGSGGIADAAKTAELLLTQMNADPIATITSAHTDTLPASEDTVALAQIEALAEKIRAR